MGPNMGWWAHVQTRRIMPHNYSTRWLLECQMSYVNLQGVGDVEASEGPRVTTITVYDPSCVEVPVIPTIDGKENRCPDCL